MAQNEHGGPERTRPNFGAQIEVFYIQNRLHQNYRLFVCLLFSFLLIAFVYLTHFYYSFSVLNFNLCSIDFSQVVHVLAKRIECGLDLNLYDVFFRGNLF